MIDSDTATVVFAYAALIVGLVFLAYAGMGLVALFNLDDPIEQLEQADGEYL